MVLVRPGADSTARRMASLEERQAIIAEVHVPPVGRLPFEEEGRRTEYAARDRLIGAQGAGVPSGESARGG